MHPVTCSVNESVDICCVNIDPLRSLSITFQSISCIIEGGGPK